MGVRNCSMFCCTLLNVHSSIAIILMGKRELNALLNLSSWCLVMVERLFLAVPRGCLQFVIVVFPDHTHLLLRYFVLHSTNDSLNPSSANSEKTIIFSRSQRGFNFFQGVQLFPGAAVRMLILLKPIELVIFQGGGGPDPLSHPLWIRARSVVEKLKSRGCSARML